MFKINLNLHLNVHKTLQSPVESENSTIRSELLEYDMTPTQIYWKVLGGLLFLKITEIFAAVCPHCRKRNGKCREPHYDIEKYLDKSPGFYEDIHSGLHYSSDRVLNEFVEALRTGAGKKITGAEMAQWNKDNPLAFSWLHISENMPKLFQAIEDYYDETVNRHGSVLDFVGKFTGNPMDSFTIINNN